MKPTWTSDCGIVEKYRCGDCGGCVADPRSVRCKACWAASIRGATKSSVVLCNCMECGVTFPSATRCRKLCTELCRSRYYARRRDPATRKKTPRTPRKKIPKGTSTNRVSIIYVLRDPITESVRYVGKTELSLPARLASHISSGKPHLPVVRWIKKLKLLGLYPTIHEVQEIEPGGDWGQADRRWIKRLKKRSVRLCNVSEGGGSGKKTPSHVAKIAAALRTGDTFSCQLCKKDFYRKKSDIAKGHNKFCSHLCANRGRVR